MSTPTEPVATSDPAVELAAFATDLAYDDLPAEAVRLAERCFVDTVGVALAGSQEGAGATAGDVVRALAPAGGDVSLLAVDASAPVTDAAFANGTAGHGLDFDDVSPGVGHPSVPLVSTILAVGEATDATGEDAIAAYVAGFETQQYLASAISDSHYAAGWHSTATFGTFGATAAAGSLLGLDAAEMEHALNVASSMPAGLKRNFGSMTKPMHVGHAARAGVTAAYLAESGFTGAEGSVGADGGFLDLYDGGEPADLDAFFDLGEEWTLLERGINVKKYPCCYFTHTSIAAARRLVDQHDIDSGDVERVTVEAPEAAAGALHYEDPDTGLEGKFSMEYTVASAIARDRVGLAAFDDENVDDPAVQAVREVVEFTVDPDADSGGSTVTIETSAGEFTRQQDRPPGTHGDPLSDEELREKFLMCADRALLDEAARRAHAALDDLREQDSVAAVVAGIRP